ncbi:MAG: sulfurtransferase TusA family protein [Candidatus Rokuibacteriota bacterium]
MPLHRVNVPGLGWANPPEKFDKFRRGHGVRRLRRTAGQCQNAGGTMLVTPDKKLDCIGLFCPMPVLKVREALTTMAVGQVLEMLADDPASEADLRSWSARTGHQLLVVDKDGPVFRFLVRKTK